MQFLLLALATFVTEDLTCIATGALVAQGKIGFLPGTMACLMGIYAGDMLLFLGGRFARPLAARFVSSEKIARASEWISSRGMAVVFLSRFAPGLRLPTYVAAGLLGTRFWRFTIYFLAAAAIWTPLLVGASALGSEFLGAARVLPAIIALALVLRSFRARRRVVGFLKRKMRWEFWPAWAAYIPVAPYLLYLAIRNRSLSLFTAANPGIPSGGFVGESKSQILKHLSELEGVVASFDVIPGSAEVYARTRRALAFLVRNGLDFPVVLKPDVGERGSGVAIVRSRSELERYLESTRSDTIIQEYVAGVEFGVFYIRRPGERQGRISSITEKHFPDVTGDGQSTVEQLVLRDSRAVCLAGVYRRSSGKAAGYVPRVGESVTLVEIGSHCRGAIFLDGIRLRTKVLEAAIERVSRAHPGFYFGRFDLRTASVEAFQRGEFKVIELNGVSAEATHVYDPAVSLLETYRAIFRHWRIAFEVGALNRARGAEPMRTRDLLRLILTRQTPNRRGGYYAGTVEVVD